METMLLRRASRWFSSAATLAWATTGCGRIGFDSYLDASMGRDASTEASASDARRDVVGNAPDAARVDASKNDAFVQDGARKDAIGDVVSTDAISKTDAVVDSGSKADATDDATAKVDAPGDAMKDAPLKPEASAFAEAAAASDAHLDVEVDGGCPGGCPAAQSCVGGACVCPSNAPDTCGAGSSLSCVNLKNSPATCGTCSNACLPAAPFCISGGCATFDTSTLVGSWKLNEATGTTAADSTANDNTGTVVGSTTIVEGRIGDARSFDGTTAYIVTASPVQVSVTAYSIGAGFSTTSTGWQVLFANRGVTVTSGHSLTLAMGDQGAAGQLQWLLDVDGFGVGIQSTASYNDGAWHYVVATWMAAAGSTIDPTQFQLYVDGSAPVTTTNFAINSSCGTCIESPLSGVQGAQIGDSLPWSSGTAPVFWKGRIDEVTAWSSVLTPFDIAALYNGGNGLSVP